MRIIFLDNSTDFTATSINLKALDSIQKILINFSIELSKKKHKVIIYNNIREEKYEQGVYWKNISNCKKDSSDILIIFQDTELLKYNVNAKLKFFLLHNKPDNSFNKNVLINLLKNKFCLLYTNYYLINELPDNYKYIPKLLFKIGVSENFTKLNIVNSSPANVFTTTHPIKGIDWLIDLWLEYIHLQIPWAQLHIYSRTLLPTVHSDKIRIKNIKLKLELNKNSGILVKKPLSEKEFISQLNQYKLYLCPTLGNDFHSLGVLESQASGIPVIARESQAIYDYIYNTETGYIINDKQRFATKIIQVLNNNKLFLTLRNNSKLNNYVLSWHDVVTEFERKINENTFYR